MNCRVEASVKDSGFGSMLLVARAILELLRSSRIRFSTDRRLTQSSHDVRVSTHPPLKNAIELSNRPSNSILRTVNALKKDIVNTVDTTQRTIISCKQKEAESSNNVRAGPPTVGPTETRHVEELSREMSRTVDGISNLHDQQVNNQAPKEET